MGSMNFRGFALGLTAAATVLLRHPVGAEKQADLSFHWAARASRRVTPCGWRSGPGICQLDDDGYPDRRYAILIVDGAPRGCHRSDIQMRRASPPARNKAARSQ
jgi:hypothetical protein